MSGVDRAARSLKERGLVWIDRPRVLVTGGRDYVNVLTVNRVLSELAPGEIAQGGASGADRLAALWAHDTGTNCVTFPADWAAHGRAAGPIRNRRMLDEFRPDLVLAFPGGRGTAHMVSYADFCGVPVIRTVEPESAVEVF